MAKNEKLVDIKCVVRQERENSIAIADGTMVTEGSSSNWREREKWFWLPRSLVEINDDGTVTMPEFLAIEKGLV